MTTYRIMVGVTGLFYVDAESDVEAECAIKSAIEKGCLTLAGSPLIGARATASVVREIAVEPEAGAQPSIRPGHHVLEAHSMKVGQRLDTIGPLKGEGPGKNKVH